MAKTTKAAAAKTKAPAKPKKIPAADQTVVEKKVGTSPVIDPKKTEGTNPPAVDNKPATSEKNDEQGTNKQDVCVVIPYVHDKANGDELRYALRAWEKHLPGCRIVLIGDKPDFISDLVHHIEGLALGANPQIDVAKKLMQAIASEEVPSSFIFTNDDIYPVAPVDLEDLKVLRCNGILGQKKNATPGYLEKTNATIAALSAENSPLFDYGTHLPVVYEKYNLAQILSHFKAEERGLLISSLYFNSVFYDQEPEIVKGNADGTHVAYIYRANPNKELLEKVFETRNFINHNSEGYAPTLPLLQKHFPGTSKFEK